MWLFAGSLDDYAGRNDAFEDLLSAEKLYDILHRQCIETDRFKESNVPEPMMVVNIHGSEQRMIH